MADYLPIRHTIYAFLLGFQLHFLPISAGLPIHPNTLCAIKSTENLHPLDLDIDGTDPLEKTLNCLNLGLRLTFLGICAGWWAQGTLLLLSENELQSK